MHTFLLLFRAALKVLHKMGIKMQITFWNSIQFGLRMRNKSLSLFRKSNGVC